MKYLNKYENKRGLQIKLVTFIFDWYTFHYENNYCFYLYYQLISLVHAICIKSYTYIFLFVHQYKV